MPEDEEINEGDGDQGNIDNEPTVDELVGMVSGAYYMVGRFKDGQEFADSIVSGPSDLAQPGLDEHLSFLRGLKTEYADKVADRLEKRVEIFKAEEAAHAENAEKDDETRLWREVEGELKQKQAESALAAKKARIREQIKQTQAVDAVAAGPTADAAALEALEAAVAVIDDPETDWATKDAAAGEAIDAMAAVEVGTEQRPVTFDTEQFLKDVKTELEQRKEK